LLRFAGRISEAQSAARLTGQRLSADYAALIHPTALPRYSESVAPIVSFVGEYSAHFADEDFPRVHAIEHLRARLFTSR
jgi:uncharacterized protein (DUF2336 family)